MFWFLFFLDMFYINNDNNNVIIIIIIIIIIVFFKCYFFPFCVLGGCAMFSWCFWGQG